MTAMEVEIDKVKVRKMGGSYYVMVTKYGFNLGDSVIVKKDDKGRIILEKVVEDESNK